jgi:hypothetical protein
VKLPRLDVRLLVIVVAIVVLNFAAVRAVFGHAGLVNELLAVGVAPILSVLAIGVLVGYRCPDRRLFLLGFESFGPMALAIYVVLASCVPDETIGPYLRAVVKPLARIVGTDRDVLIMPIAHYSVVVTALAVPQIAFALIGGFLSRRYKVTIIRR